MSLFRLLLRRSVVVIPSLTDDCSASWVADQMRDDDDEGDEEEPPYSVRRLRQVYLDRVRASAGSSAPRRITPLAASVTPSLPYIPEVDEVLSV